MNYQQLKSLIESKGYKWFDNNKPYNLNIIGIRENYIVNDLFKDKIYVAYKDNYMIERVLIMEATTIAGKHWFLNLFNPKGTAIIIPNQYHGVYKLGLHHGQEALVQVGTFAIWRDKNKNLVADKMYKETAINTALNIHRAGKGIVSKIVNQWSAGCQVVADSEKMDKFILLVKKSIELYGNSFTYTLLDK